MIQATESLNIKKTPRMQARIEMLVWYLLFDPRLRQQGLTYSGGTLLSLSHAVRAAFCPNPPSSVSSTTTKTTRPSTASPAARKRSSDR